LEIIKLEKYSNTVYYLLVSLQISPICQRPNFTCDFHKALAHPIDCCVFAGDLWVLFFGEKTALQNKYPTQWFKTIHIRIDLVWNGKWLEFTLTKQERIYMTKHMM